MRQAPERGVCGCISHVQAMVAILMRAGGQSMGRRGTQRWCRRVGGRNAAGHGDSAGWREQHRGPGIDHPRQRNADHGGESSSSGPVCDWRGGCCSGDELHVQRVEWLGCVLMRRQRRDGYTDSNPHPGDAPCQRWYAVHRVHGHQDVQRVYVGGGSGGYGVGVWLWRDAVPSCVCVCVPVVQAPTPPPRTAAPACSKARH